MKKKILALILCAMMAATAVVGGTLAYFSDADKDVNVMTTGNIKIVQNETDRNGNAYEDGQSLLPAVYLDENDKPYNPTNTWEGPKTLEVFEGPDGKDMKMYTSINNEIDKVVSVTNRGNVDAYVRTIVLFESNEDMIENVHVNFSSAVPLEKMEITTDDGKDYFAWIFTYANPLTAGETSMASIKQIWLNPKTDSDWYEKLGEDGQLTIIALSQAAQTTGFKDAAEALNTAFGEVNGTNVTNWLEETNVKTDGLNNTVAGGLAYEEPTTTTP